MEQSNKSSFRPLEDAFNNWYSNRVELIEKLKHLVLDLNIKHKNVQIARISGTSAAIAGTVVTGVGVGLSFFTFGLSTPLIIGGIVTGGLGGVTSAGASLFDYKQACNKARIIQDMLLHDASLYQEMGSALLKTSIVKDESSLERNVLLDETIKTTSKGKVSVRTILQSMIKKEVILEAIGSGVKHSSNAVRTGASVTSAVLNVSSFTSKALACGGLALGLVTIPIDVYVLVRDAKDLNKPAELCEKIIPIIDKLKDELLEMEVMHQEGDEFDFEGEDFDLVDEPEVVV
ncbi:hypothetical protein AKO1_005978 [Acrasis kona]|uniref:CtaA n=1 Tax=Acrasis kona TaxID=1008807 RepID=A0AAW2YIT9_9EUKA